MLTVHSVISIIIIVIFYCHMQLFIYKHYAIVLGWRQNSLRLVF